MDRNFDMDDEMNMHDDEGKMAKADLYKMAKYSTKLFKMIDEHQQLEGWVQAKITKAADYIASVYHYMEYELKISDYGSKLENSDMYSESVRRAFEQKLVEAKMKKEKFNAKMKKDKKLAENTPASAAPPNLTAAQRAKWETGKAEWEAARRAKMAPAKKSQPSNTPTGGYQATDILGSDDPVGEMEKIHQKNIQDIKSRSK